jgi:biotin carboxylase
MRRILIVAATTGYQTRMFVEAAGRLGYEVALATDRCHVLADPWGDRAIPLRFDDPGGSAARVAETAAVDGIVALGDRPAYVASVIAQRLGVLYNSPESVRACRDKHLMRERFRAFGLNVPDYRRVPMDDDPAPHSRQAAYPCVLKPLGLSASRGVIRADNPGEFVAAFERIGAILKSPDVARLRERQDEYIQIESFIPGREFALEGLLAGGRLHAIAVFDKPDPLDGPYFEETIYVTPSRAPAAAQRAIVDAAQQAATALGLTEGPVHAEMRVNEGGVRMLEVAARPIGGLCARVLPELPETILRHAAGERPARIPHLDGAAGVMMIPVPRAGIYERTDGIDAALAVAGVEDVVITAKQGQRLEPLPEGNSYPGFIFARGNTPQAVERSLREAHAQLSFEIREALPVL